MCWSGTAYIELFSSWLLIYVWQLLRIHLDNDLCSIRRFVRQNLNVLQVMRACWWWGGGEIGQMMLLIERQLKERWRTWTNLSELCKPCDFKLNYRWFVSTQTLYCNLNLLYVYLGYAKRFVTEIFTISLITCFDLTG